MKPLLQSLTKIKDVHELSDKRGSQSFNTTTVVLSIQEAECLVSSLEEFPVDAIGCSPFMKMYAYDLERLSLQAHMSAQCQDGDEYVVEAILTHKKLPILIKTLLAIEAWRTFVLAPKNNYTKRNGDPPMEKCASNATLAEKLASHQLSLRCAFILHAEVSLCSLLNLILYRKGNAEEMDNECSISLVDYCARQMSSLAMPVKDNPMTRRQRYPGTVEEVAKHIQNRSLLEEIHENLLDHEFKVAVVATSLARYLCEHIESFTMGAQTRILDTHDYLQMMVPLIDEPPWTRRRRVSNKKDDIVWEKLYDNFEWRKVEPKQLLQITEYEAQCWIAIFHLTCSTVCRQRYALNVYRKEHLLRLRKFLNEVMVEQLPVLADVMRYMDELALLNVPETSTGQGSALLLQQVDTMRDEVLRNKNWHEIGNMQFKSIFSKTTDADDEIIRLIGTLYDDEIGSFLDGGVVPVSDRILSLPVTMISLSSGSVENIYIMTPVHDEGTVVQTALGQLERMKLKLHCTDDQPFQFEKVISLKAVISVNQIEKYATLTLDTSLSDDDDVAKSQWIQLGRTEEDGYALQLLFKPVKPCDGLGARFVLRQAFVSRTL